MQLITCRGCRRHIRAEEHACPFCASAPSRLPRALVELGIAATASVGLAACYGAPPRYRSGEPDRVEHAFRLGSQPGALVHIDANAPGANCEARLAGDSRRHLKCGKLEALVEEEASGLSVRCRGGTEWDCRMMVEQLTAPPKAP